VPRRHRNRSGAGPSSSRAGEQLGFNPNRHGRTAREENGGSVESNGGGGWGTGRVDRVRCE
jgi:hypothetical protein